MKNLLNFLLKYHNVILFLFLEGLAFSWLIKGNSYHNSRMVKGMQGMTRGIEERISNVRSYLQLREINANLAEENSLLNDKLQSLSGFQDLQFVSVNDTTLSHNYSYTSASVINNSVNKQKNYFTIDKGKKQGVDVDMAVTSSNNVAGLIVGSSENFSVAISILNIDFRLSARIKSNGYFGSLSWDGKNYRHAVLNEIPQHISINIGDTIETTSYSAIFPEGITIGRISDFKKSGSDFYVITVELFTDFRNLHYVNIISNLKRKEQVETENQYQ
jgi:rod shape-determining protein MreC